MPHPYKNILNFNGVTSTNESYDTEAGTFRRKRSLVRKDRARPHSYTAGGPRYGRITHSNSARFSQNSSIRAGNSAPEDYDHYYQDGIQLQTFSADQSNRNRWSDDQFSIVSENSEQNDPFFAATVKQNELNEGTVKPVEIDHLNDEYEERNSYEREVVTTNDALLKGFQDDEHLENEHFTAIPPKRMDLEEDRKGFPYWKIYCYLVTCWAPSPVLKLFGLKTKDRQYAWREKMGLISIILMFGAIVAFLTYGFNRATCTTLAPRLKPKDILTSFLVIGGKAYLLDSSAHPAAPGIEANSNILYPPINAGGKDASLLFQNVNGNCKGLIKAREDSTIPHNGDELAWYMPCKLMNLDGSTQPNFTVEYYDGYACHTSSAARSAYYNLKVAGDLFYTWEDITNAKRNLIVYNGNVIDMGIIDWLYKDQLTYPNLFDEIKNDRTMKGYDISLLLTEPHQRQVASCLVEIAKIGVVDTSTVGCVASTIVLYLSLVFVLLIVGVQFAIAVYFKWFIAPYQGVPYSSIKEMVAQSNQIEDWVNDPNNSAPINEVPIKRRANYHSKKNRNLRLSWGGDINDFIEEKPTLNTSKDYNPKYITMTTEAYMMANQRKKNTRNIASQSSLFSPAASTINPFKPSDPFADDEIETLDPMLISKDVISQPPVSWEPFGYPLIHTMCLVTCYSEDEAGIRTTLDSIATTDYPNSHKLIVVICDGLITGAGNDKPTPDICLDMMMDDFVVSKDEVEPFSYVSVAQGSKRHNMAKVYAGFYKYDNSTIPIEKQQKTPMLLIVKCGTSAEMSSAKPGNRGKRDSQIILMSFLQAVTFNERMTPLQFEMTKAIWQVTGLMPTMYEAVLMVDADTLVYPDCLTHMIAELVKDADIMGLCGETKISNKTQSWVTAIQVFEYYISHHQAKAFESVFGSVTCLPGCFCMYRIKSPKSANVWVPILANSDIVEKYSDNVLDSLHKKNLLLLGEDRYLSSLMLRAFPRRKQIFIPKAACKTVVPDTFKVLLSQRRRWINSTVHNLMELALVKDLCGAFCLSMQFVIAIQLIGTFVLPVAISLTVYIIFVAIFSTPTPIISLVLMAVIFGLPALLIVVTVSNLMYILWMVAYILSLPIWSLILPTYSFWKFDDFSWGDTRKTEGDTKGGHGDVDGEFDGSQIKQMTWREFERERRQSEFNENFDTEYHRPNIASVYHPGNYAFETETDYVDMNHQYQD